MLTFASKQSDGFVKKLITKYYIKVFIINGFISFATSSKVPCVETDI